MRYMITLTSYKVPFTLLESDRKLYQGAFQLLSVLHYSSALTFNMPMQLTSVPGFADHSFV